MPRIRVTPSHLHNTAKRCRSQAEVLRALAHGLSRALYGLETGGFQSRSLNPVIDQWSALRRRFLVAVGELEELADKLTLYAIRFEEADQIGLNSIVALQPKISYLVNLTESWWVELGPVVTFPPQRLRVWETIQIPELWEKTPLHITYLSAVRDSIEE